MELNTDLVVLFIRMFITNVFVYYSFEKISNCKENRLRNNIILAGISIVLLVIYVLLKNNLESFLPFAMLYFMYTIAISKTTNRKLGYTMIITIIAYAGLAVLHTISIAIQFIPYKLFDIDNMYISLIIISLIEAMLLYVFFKIKRFKNGFSFLNAKLNNEIFDIIMLNISCIIILVYCIFEIYSEEMRKNIFIMFGLLSIIMFFTIKKMLTMHYKQKLLTDTMEEYKKEIAERQNEIDTLKQDKKNVSKITHEFYNRQKALELLVASNMNKENIDKENISPNVLSIIESLTNEYSEKFNNIKELPKLDETEILEIDNMFKYMQSECNKNNINFKLKVMGNIHYLVNNIISKNKLETLIGDHLRDAINAVNLNNEVSKEILAILGIKNKKYELSIYDTGVEFTVDTLMKLGLEAVTTNAERGGTGTGFMTTFETLAETKASLIITEYMKTEDNAYTKCVTIRFDGKKQYKIYSYRAEELRIACGGNRIKIEGIKSK